jgi:hypothetical protein
LSASGDERLCLGSDSATAESFFLAAKLAQDVRKTELATINVSSENEVNA